MSLKKYNYFVCKFININNEYLFYFLIQSAHDNNASSHEEKHDEEVNAKNDDLPQALVSFHCSYDNLMC